MNKQNKTDGISQNQLNSIVSQAQSIPFKSMFSPFIESILNVFSYVFLLLILI